MTSCGLIVEPSSGTRKVFCHICPNPWSGLATRLPVTLSTWAPATPSADSRSTGLAQWAPSRDVGASGALGGVFSVSVMSHSHGRDGRLFVLVDLDRLVEAGQRQDLAVVLGQAARQQAHAAALGTHQERDEQSDATAVHVLQPREVENY